MKIIATLESIYSRRDRNGNCYWAFRFTDHETWKTVEGKISGDESNIDQIRLYWLPGGSTNSIARHTTAMGIREFNRATKGWKYAGCTGLELVEFIRANLAAQAQPA